jgi:hypothetical protein
MTPQCTTPQVTDEDALLVFIDAVVRYYDFAARLVQFYAILKRGFEYGRLPAGFQNLGELYHDDVSALFIAIEALMQKGRITEIKAHYRPSFGGYLHALVVKSQMGYSAEELERLVGGLTG